MRSVLLLKLFSFRNKFVYTQSGKELQSCVHHITLAWCDMYKYGRIFKIGAWCLLSLLLIVCLRRIGFDARYVQKKLETRRAKTGECPMRRSCRLRSKNNSIDSIEERVSFTSRVSADSQERIVRHGVLVRRPHARAVIVICHGFMCNKDDVRFLRGVIFNDYTTFSFDFRAHGECTAGQACTFGFGEKYDVIGAVEFIRSQPDLRNKPLIVYGFSMGAVSALLAQAERPDLFGAAIFDCPFDSTDDLLDRLIDKVKFSVAGYEFGLPGRSLWQRYAYNSYVQEILKRTFKTASALDGTIINTFVVPINTVAAARSITIPSFFIVCKKDEKAPLIAVKKVYDAVKGYKRLWVTNGRFHFDSFFFNPEKYAYKVVNFIEHFLDGALSTSVLAKISIDSETILTNTTTHEIPEALSKAQGACCV